MRHHSRHGHWGGHHGHDHRSEAFAAFAEKFAIGRGHRGGFGRRGGGGDEDGSEGFGRGFGGRGGGGRLLGHGDLRLLLLALIGEKPSHGYDLGVAPRRWKEAARAAFGGQATTVACE